MTGAPRLLVRMDLQRSSWSMQLPNAGPVLAGETLDALELMEHD